MLISIFQFVKSNFNLDLFSSWLSTHNSNFNSMGLFLLLHAIFILESLLSASVHRTDPQTRKYIQSISVNTLVVCLDRL